MLTPESPPVPRQENPLSIQSTLPGTPEPQSDTSIVYIDIRVDRIEDIFHPLDPAPLSDRELNPDIVAYFTEKVLRVDLKRPVTFRVILPSPSEDDSRLVTRAFQEHVQRASVNARIERKDHVRESVRMLVVSIVFALILIIVMDFIVEATELLSGSIARFIDRIAKAISIIIWVILWKPTETLIFGRRPHRERIKVIERLQNAKAICLSSADIPTRV